VENSGDGVGIGDHLEDTHAAAAFSAAGDVDSEDAGEELGPRDASGSGRGSWRGSERVVGEGEVQRELRRWQRCGGPGDDSLAQAMVAGEHTVIAGHMELGRRDQGAEAGEELVGVHVGVGGARGPWSAPGAGGPTDDARQERPRQRPLHQVVGAVAEPGHDASLAAQQPLDRGRGDLGGIHGEAIGEAADA